MTRRSRRRVAARGAATPGAWIALVALAMLAASAHANDAPLASGTAASAQAAAASLSERAALGDADAIAALVPLVHAEDSKVRYHAVWGLARAGAPAVEPLLAGFRARSDDPGRARIARVLGQMGLVAAPAVPALRAALVLPDSQTCGAAAYALGRTRAREALPELVGAYARSRTLSNQRQIARAMREIGSDQSGRRAREALVDSLAVQLAARDPAARAAAVETSAALYRAARRGDEDLPSGTELRPLVPGLIAALEDPDPAREQAALRALALAGRDARAATPKLAQRLASEPDPPDPQTLHAIEEALAAFASPDADRVLAGLAAERALAARIRTRYSIRDHQGQTELLPFRVAGNAERGLQLSLRFLYPGRTPSAPERIIVYLESTSPQVRFEQERSLTWLADGASLAMQPLERSWARGQNGGVIEQLAGALDVDAFRRIARAGSLRARIGDASFVLGEADQQALRHFASRIPTAAPAAGTR